MKYRECNKDDKRLQIFQKISEVQGQIGALVLRKEHFEMKAIQLKKHQNSKQTRILLIIIRI